MAHLNIDTGTWLLVADGEKAMFLRNDGDDQDYNFNVVRLKEQDNPSDREQSANRPGRKYDGGPSQRSAMDDTDWHELGKERFADDLADLLYKYAYRNRFSAIVLAAAPATLGALRDKLHVEVTRRVVGEIDKDFTNHPLDELEKRIAAEAA